MIYAHSGDLGDTLYSLPVLACLGEGELILNPSVNVVREPWTEDKVLKVISLFESQPYITRCRFGDRPEQCVNLDDWRKRYRRKTNLADAVAQHFRLRVWDRETPWIVCDYYNEDTKGKAVFHRSPRYHARDFPWREMVEMTKGNAVFIGSPEEHLTFTREFGDMPYYPTPTLMNLARVLAGSRMFFGNQSSPRALAEGLKVRVYVEEDSWSQNTNFPRQGAFYGRRQLRQAQEAWAASYRFE